MAYVPIDIWSEEVKQEIVNRLNAKGLRPRCPMCGNPHFSVVAGLFINDRAAYARGAARQRSQSGEVPTQFGCIVSQQPVAVVLEEMDRGEWSREFLSGRPRPLTGWATIPSR